MAADSIGKGLRYCAIADRQFLNSFDINVGKMMKKTLRNYLELFSAFAIVGATTFGGGLAMLPILQREISEKRKWVTEEEIADYYAIGQCTPGIIAVNTATFVGVKQAGILGGIIATLGLVTPSVIIISLIAAFLTGFAHIEAVRHAFNGIRAAVCALILDSILKLKKNAIEDILSWVIFIIIVALSLFTDISSVYLIAASGFVAFLLKGRK